MMTQNNNPLEIKSLSSSFQPALGPFACNHSGQSPHQEGSTEDVNSMGSTLPYQASQEALTSPVLQSPSQLRNRLHNQLTPTQQLGIPLVLMLQPAASFHMANAASSSLTQRPRSFTSANIQRDIHPAQPSWQERAPEFTRIDLGLTSHSRDGKTFGSCSQTNRLCSPPFITSSSRNGMFDEVTTILSDESFSSSSTCSSASSPPPTLTESPFLAIIRPFGSFRTAWHWNLDRKPISSGSSLLGHTGVHPQSKKKLRLEPADSVTSALTSKRVNKWDRRLQAKVVHQQRRRLRQLVFYGSFIVTCGIFICGLTLIRFRSHQTRVSFSNELHNRLGLSSKLHESAFLSAIEAPERDTLVLYRIIGNDLPPRHSASQTLTNLKFILEQESTFEQFPSLIPSHLSTGAVGPQQTLQLKRFFVLNRIANQTQLEKVREILTAHGVKGDQILVNSFDAEAYRAQPFNWSPEVGWGAGMEKVWGIKSDRSHLEHGIESDPVNSAPIHQQMALEENHSTEENLAWFNRNMSMIRWKALDFTYHSKNLYAMNNNGGRNFALEHGRSLANARWILPLDGNCFFTPSALHSLVDSLRETELRPDAPSHVVIPMSRLLDNEQALAQNSPINLSEEPNDGQPRLPSQRPNAPDEPQVGFRFSSRETFSREMRYGRRSKLEFLWRLGAIERNRNLDTRSADWEVMEKSILTPESYGSIRRATRAPRRPSATSNSPAPADFIRAGWVLRLFSGDQKQEEHSDTATLRRSINRMKGITSFLESLDESVARGGSHCAESCLSEECGFADWRLWSLNGAELVQWKHKYTMGDRKSIQFVDRLSDFARLPMRYAASMLAGEKAALEKANDLQSVSVAVFVLALAAYMLDNSQYAEAASSLVSLKFLQQGHFMSTPNAFAVSLNPRLRSLRLQTDYEGTGYLFPILRHDQSLSRWMEPTGLHYLPFDPHTFDPTLLLDGIRLLSGTWQAPTKQSDCQSQTRSLSSSPLPQRRLLEIFTLQTTYLLLNDSIVQEGSSQPPSTAAGLEYDLKLGALASFTDDARLLGRIASRNQIRLPLSLFSADAQRAPLLDWDPVTTPAIDAYRRFRRSLRNVQLRPFDQQRLPSVLSISHENLQDSFYLPPSSFSHLRFPSETAQVATVSHPSFEQLLPA